MLYTSTLREGALAEISFHLSLLNPIPSKPVMLHKIGVATKNTLRLARADLVDLGIDWSKYGSLDYDACQKIGAAVAFLECDGLLAPSARWDCQNLVIFTNNHGLEQQLDLVESSEVNWIEWATKNGLLGKP